MPSIIDARVSTRTETDVSELDASLLERLIRGVEQTKLSVQAGLPFAIVSVTSVPTEYSWFDLPTSPEITLIPPGPVELRKTVGDAWLTMSELFGYQALVHRSTRATNPTSTTLSSVAELLRKRRRDERVRRLSPNARAAYESIRKLRDEIGPVDLDIASALRELRDHG